MGGVIGFGVVMSVIGLYGIACGLSARAMHDHRNDAGDYIVAGITFLGLGVFFIASGLT